VGEVAVTRNLRKRIEKLEHEFVDPEIALQALAEWFGFQREIPLAVDREHPGYLKRLAKEFREGGGITWPDFVLLHDKREEMNKAEDEMKRDVG
jgi:hypothetical protein